MWRLCKAGNATCEFTNVSDGTSCDGSNGGCQSGICVDNCTGVDCSDGNPCTQDVCDSAAAGTCSSPPEPAGTLCDAGGGVTVNSPVLIPLPPVAVSCVADAGPGPVAFCADGTTPGTVLGSDPPVDTYIEIVTSFFIDYVCSPGVASVDATSVDPIDPTVDCITFPFTP